MKQHSKLSQEQQHAVGHEASQEAGHEFASADEVLRFDAAHTAVPPQIAQRLLQSVASATPPRRSWWKNLFGK